MEFHLQGQHYKLYGVEDLVLKKGEMEPHKRRRCIDKHTTIKEKKYYIKKLLGFTFHDQVKIFQGMMHTLQIILPILKSKTNSISYN